MTRHTPSPTANAQDVTATLVNAPLCVAETPARPLLIDFMTSPSYDPKAKRHGDTIESAIDFTLRSQTAERLEASEFVAMVSRLTHSGDDGWTPPSDADDSLASLDSLIAQARDIRFARVVQS